MSFDRFEIHAVLHDIETYLGYLKGNELAAEYLNRCHVELKESDSSASPTHLELSAGYTFPCPDSRWQVTPHALLRRFALPTNTEDPSANYLLIKSFEQGADESWAAGPRWAAGLGAQCYDICQYIVQPDSYALATAVQRLVDEVSDPLIVTNQDWASIEVLTGNWHGGAGYQFAKFYRRYADVAATMSLFSGKAAAGFAFATRVVHQTQVGLLEYLKGVREVLETDLTAWVQEGQQPFPDAPSRWGVLADVGQIVQDASYLIDYVPVAKDVKAAAEEAVGFLGSTAKLAADLGFDFPEKSNPAASSFQTADQLVDLVTGNLRTDFAEAYQRGLDEGFTGSWDVGPENAGDRRTGADELLNGWLEDLKLRGDWHLPRLRSDDSMYYEGDSLWGNS